MNEKMEIITTFPSSAGYGHRLCFPVSVTCGVDLDNTITGAKLASDDAPSISEPYNVKTGAGVRCSSSCQIQYTWPHATAFDIDATSGMIEFYMQVHAIPGAAGIPFGIVDAGADGLTIAMSGGAAILQYINGGVAVFQIIATLAVDAAKGLFKITWDGTTMEWFLDGASLGSRDYSGDSLNAIAAASTITVFSVSSNHPVFGAYACDASFWAYRHRQLPL